MFDKLVKNEKVVVILMCLITFVSRCLLIYYMDGPFIYADEMGYWTHAANMAGVQWSIDGTSWYSYGYSLLLVPLFWISHNMSVVYKLALVLNAIMGVISCLLCYSIAAKLAPKLEKWVIGVLSLVVTMYPAFLAQSYIAWAETELFMLVWLLLWLVLKYEQQDEPERNGGSYKGWKRLGCAALIGLTCGYLYLVHNRTLGIMVACVMIVVLMAAFKKMRWQDGVLILMLLAAVYVVNVPVKGVLSAKAAVHFIDSDTMRGNGISSGVSKMKKLTSVDGIKGLIYSLAGQLWYLTAASGLLLFWGIKACIEKILKEKEHALFYSFTLLSFAGMTAISSLSAMKTKAIDTSQRVRLDPYFFGRYIECILGPILLIALLYLVQQALDKKALLWQGVFLLLLLCTALVLGYRLRGVSDFYVQSCSVFGLEYYRLFGEFSIPLCTAAAAVLSLCLFFGLGRVQPFRAQSAANCVLAQWGRFIAVCGICILFWGLTGLQGIRSFEMVEQRYTRQYAELFDYIGQLDADQIYVYGSYKSAADVQTRTVEKEVIRLSDDFAQIDDVEAGNYLVLETENAKQYGLDKLEVCYEYLDYVVCRK
jgi:hypothetical protein